jgi:hypothetical protein
MTKVKYFEIRDSATCISAMAVAPKSQNAAERFILGREGYGTGEGYLILTHLGSGETYSDPYKWPTYRTMRIAHQYLQKNWFNLESGEVIDVEYIEGERTTPKKSDRYYGETLS